MGFLDIFSRQFWNKYGKKSPEEQTRKPLLLGNTGTQTMKMFDIVVFTQDEGRMPQQRTENGVKALNAQQLKQVYAACGEQIRILREYDDPSTPPQPEPKAPIEASPQNMKSGQQTPMEAPKISPILSQPQPRYATVPKKSPPKYFNICGTECKFEDDKIYQKQWVKILGNEASQYRLISDANNKEISLNGKHLEMLKWVLVQNESENSDSGLNASIKQILNG